MALTSTEVNMFNLVVNRLCMLWWPRRLLLRLVDYLPERASNWLLDRLFPDDMICHFDTGE